jgi:hypothetical protein
VLEMWGCTPTSDQRLPLLSSSVAPPPATHAVRACVSGQTR